MESEHINLGGFFVDATQGFISLPCTQDTQEKNGMITHKLKAYWSMGDIFLNLENYTGERTIITLVDDKGVQLISPQMLTYTQHYSIQIGEVPHDRYQVVLTISIQPKNREEIRCQVDLLFDMYNL